MDITPKALVGAGLYPDEKAVAKEALRVLWQERPRLRMEWAVYQYQTQEISLAKAAALAGVSFDKMKEFLLERGIQPRLGSETKEEAISELKVIEQFLREKE